MVFGSNTSATSWEPFRRSIEALSVVFANIPDLVVKRRSFLNLIRWDTACLPDQIFVQAKRCPMHEGVIADDGTEQPSKSRIYVDDALLAARNKAQMEMALAATLEAIFTVMGQPNKTPRKCPVAMDK